MAFTVMVVGAGNMGRHHVRVYNELPQVGRVLVVDPSEESRQKVVERNFEKAECFSSIREALAEKPEAATIAVPTQLHFAVANELMEKGVSLLVEKPITDDLKSGAKLMARAAEKKITLQVGHVERFNPAVLALKEHIGMLGRVVYATAHRFGIPTPAKLGDAFFDQAVHDIDVLTFLTGKRPKTVLAHERKILDKESNDLCAAIFEYEGFDATVEANRVAPIKTRELFVIGLEGTAHLDFNAQELTISKLDSIPRQYTEFKTFNELIARAGRGNELRLFIQKDEPLRLELQSFLRSVERKTEPMVTALDGLYAIAASQAAVKAAQSGKREKVSL
ncbi:oxidoreductase [Candidatus Micrarchaeota archaeon CG08_land_8_20_14_0_20_59_11]|nr:MAG: oxidoreductase [Candidatus Micrarchaeota archaeon CG08_land_8_20_14_0_20_59_11]